jgi:flagellin
MSSILTNNSAMVALQTLTKTMQELQTTQSRISTGMRVANASDNAAYWSIATTMKSDNGALGAVKDALNLGSATIDVDSSALNATKDVVNQIKNKLVAALQPGVDRTKVQAEITALQGQLKSIADSASFSGRNWLSVDSSAAGYNATKNVVASFTRDSAGLVTTGTIDIDTTNTILFDTQTSGATGGLLDKDRTAGGSTASVTTLDISTLTDAAADQTTLQEYVQIADAALADVITAASDLGAAKARIDLQKDFVSNLSDAITKGVGSLVDADMNQESTRLQALQVQQQLGVQSLAIANQNSQMILKLFS